MSGKADDEADRQPEALATFDAAAKAGGVKPADQGTRATAGTAPKAADLAQDETDAADILAGAATGDAAQKDDAIARRRDADKRSG